jgi:hypothetical protein
MRSSPARLGTGSSIHFITDQCVPARVHSKCGATQEVRIHQFTVLLTIHDSVGEDGMGTMGSPRSGRRQVMRGLVNSASQGCIWL